MRKLAVLAVVVALVVVVAIVFLRSRPTTITTPSATSSSSGSGHDAAASADARAFPETSEQLIAAALQAKEISYEQSLLARAYALYNDPRLPKEFRSPVIDWEAGMALGIEIDGRETTLSNEILKQLAPFRARPNDPISIFNRPRADVLKAQNRPATGWASRNVPGTNVRIWIKGTQSQLDRFEPMVVDVWKVFPSFFPYPVKDDGGRSSEINPDTAIDVYFMNGGDIDPRADVCGGPNPSPARCVLGTGVTWSTTPRGSHASSAYCLVNSQRPDDGVLETIAHELAHATQAKYDYRELETPESRWLREGSATWVAHHVLKRLNKRPAGAYEALENNIDAVTNHVKTGIFQNLYKSLDVPYHWYGTWLFFFFASMEFGDGIVTKIWEANGATGLNGVDAVNAVVPFDDYFPRFAVRNWNSEPILKRYRTEDDTFPRGLGPSRINTIFTPPKIYELEPAEEPIPHLASEYFHFKFPPGTRRVSFQNFYADLPAAHIWAMRKIGVGWHDPEDWSRSQYQAFCRDIPEEDLSELVLVVSNTHLTNALPEGYPRPRVLSEENGCPYLEGWAQTTLRVKDDSQDMTYRSNRVRLRFRPRALQDQPGNVQYDLLPTSVTWTASGRKFDCTVAGTASVDIGGPLLVPTNGSAYMNVVGLDGGDFHSIIIIASPPGAIKRTCPGPVVTNDYITTGVLLQILYEPNRVENGAAVYRGRQTLDFANPFTNLPPVQGAPSGAPRLPGVPNVPGLGEMLKGTPGHSTLYTFEWELRPKNGVPPPAGPAPLRQ